VAAFTVRLSAASTQSVSVEFATANASALAGSDYLPTNGTLLFPPGSIALPVNVSVIGDTLNEGNETFLLNLSNPVNALVPLPQAIGTITDDDPIPTLAINDVLLTEGNSGSNAAIFTVSLSAASGRSVTVQFATANGTASAGNDYVAQTGTLTFPAGATSQPVSVWVLGDTVPERSETFFINLSNPTNATIADGQGLGTIQDDDFRITKLKVVGSDAIISFASIANSSNRLERANPLLPTNIWTGLVGATNVPGTGGIVTVTNSGAASQSGGFFRVRVLP
jgi:hypothetical protein